MHKGTLKYSLIMLYVLAIYFFANGLYGLATGRAVIGGSRSFRTIVYGKEAVSLNFRDIVFGLIIGGSTWMIKRYSDSDD